MSGSSLDRCVVCGEQYTDATTLDDEPIHKACAKREAEVLA